MDKQQLWNMVLTNTEPTALSVQLQVVFTEVNTGQPVFTASVSPMMISPGTTQLTPGNIGAVMFNIANPDYQIDPGPNGLLPVGTFNVCYNFLIDKYNKVVRECQQINIPPLGPLLLIQPANGSELENMYPLFSWLPPTPAKSLNNLRYDIRLVEIQEQQSPADAIKDNLQVFTTAPLTTTNYPYTNNAASLEPGKKYAWQIIAMNNLTMITKSEVWSFSIKKDAFRSLLPKPDPVFIKIKKEGAQEGSVIFWGNLRFDFLNESTDQHWNIMIEDLTTARHSSFALPMDSVVLKRGQNLVNYDATVDKRFINKHQYSLRVINEHNEVWLLRFEYRKPE